MKKYKVMLNGQNFVIDLGEGQARYGFYTTQYTNANTKAEAEDIVIASIKNRSDIKENIKNENNDPPMLYAEEIVEVDAVEEDEQEIGLSWFKEAI